MDTNQINRIYKRLKTNASAFCVLALLVVMATGLVACDEVNGTVPEYPQKGKTLLIYMVANNNLSNNAENNFADMKTGYIPDQEGSIVVYYHLSGKSPLLLHIIKDQAGQVVTDTVYRFPERNSATAASLTSAMKVTATLFPADEYGLILWSHGTGWLPQGYYDTGSISTGTSVASYSPLQVDARKEDVFFINKQAFAFEGGYPGGIDPYANLVKMADETGMSTRSFGSENGTEMEITDLAKAFPYKPSFVIFDACLMGGIEVAYQLKDTTDYVLFSPAEVLASGFPYSRIMQHIFSNPTDLVSVAQEYYYYYNAQGGFSRSGTISLIKTSELENVASAARDVFQVNREKISSLNMNGIQRYFRNNKHWFYDLGDFINQLGTAEQAAAFTAALEQAVIYKATTPYFIDIPINRYSGVSTYIPNPTNETLDTFYKRFDWNTASGMIE